jgi:hypothetical protein
LRKDERNERDGSKVLDADGIVKVEGGWFGCKSCERVEGGLG